MTPGARFRRPVQTARRRWRREHPPLPPAPPRLLGVAGVALAVWFAAVGAGCGARTVAKPAASVPRADTAVARDARNKILSGAFSFLDRLESFDEGRAYEQVFERLNQWIRALPSAAAAEAEAWKADPLVERLPERLRSLASAARLSSRSFDSQEDVRYLRDERWLATIARTARAGALDDLAIAKRLFEWTVRSLALVGDPPMVPSEQNPGTRWFTPGEILLSGRASAAQRAWIFLELLRQAGLDGAMLATADAAGGLRPWVPAVVTGGEAYLFEPAYGMPIPGPGGTGVATVRQAAADPAVLAALSLPDRPYPVQAGDVPGLAALVAADPLALAWRMGRIEEHLPAGDDTRPGMDVSALARRIAAALPGESVDRVQFWEFPWETLARRQRAPAAVQAALQDELAPQQLTLTEPGSRGGARAFRPLFAARVREFRGDIEGPEGAKAAYMAARPGRDTIAETVKRVPPAQADGARAICGRMKEDATYWLGLLTLAEGETEAAVDFLERMTLVAAPDSRWTDAARVNVARALAGSGRPLEAVKFLREDASPQRYGSRLEAARLEREAAAPAKP